MEKMSREECLLFMVEKTRTAKVATVRPDGRPHVAPVWFDLDGDKLIFTTFETTVKGKNLRHNPYVSISLDDEESPHAYVVYEGKAEVIDDMDLLRTWATKLGGKYMGQDVAEAFGKRNAVLGELVIRVTPTNITGHKKMAE
jgi:PPOX class probable F420-dependent enzyme